MKAVGIKTLKAKLSEYLRLVKSGETILITEREEVIAELRSANRNQLPETGIEHILSSLADGKLASCRSQDIKNWTGLKNRIRIPLDSTLILDELRGE